MPILIKILNEAKEGRPHMQMGGLSGINYQFNWSDVHHAWVYEANTQEAVDDIIQVNFIPRFPWRFSFILPDGITTGTPSQPAVPGEAPRYLASIPPWVAPQKYANYPVADLVELCRNCGFSPKGSYQDSANLLAQLDAYMIGRAFGLEDVKRMRILVEKAAVSSVPAAPAPAAEAKAAVAQASAEPIMAVPARARRVPAKTVAPKVVAKQPRRLALA